MVKALRKWMRTWATLDIIVLGGSLFSGWMYIMYWERHHCQPDAWFDIWPNITTEVAGAWISIRIINHLLQRREKKSRARWRQADIATYLKDLARGIARYPEGGDFDRLTDELEFYNEPHNRSERKRYLNDSERQDLDTVITFARDLVSVTRPLRDLDEKREKLKWDDPARTELKTTLITMRDAIIQKAETLADHANKARRNILEEEFQDE